jgi:hypothetical protein
MNIKFSGSTVTDDAIKVVAEFSIALSDIEKMPKSKYEKDSIVQQIISVIADRVASEYLATKKMEITNAINLKEITDAIQIKLVEGFTLQR